MGVKWKKERGRKNRMGVHFLIFRGGGHPWSSHTARTEVTDKAQISMFKDPIRADHQQLTA